MHEPTAGGVVTSPELFDAHDANVALLFGHRKEGRAAAEGWQQIVDALPSAPRPTGSDD